MRGVQGRGGTGRSPGIAVSLRRGSVVSLMLDKQHLGASSAGENVLQVLDDLLGCHATVALSPYLQLRARIRAFTPEQLDRLLDDGRAAKVACMRRTLFIESAELVPIVLVGHAGARRARTRALPRRQRADPGPLRADRRTGDRAAGWARPQRSPASPDPRDHRADLAGDHRHVRPSAPRPLEGKPRLEERPADLPALR